MNNAIKSATYICLFSLGIAFSHAQPQPSSLQIAKLGKNNNADIYFPKQKNYNEISWEEYANEFLKFYSHGDYAQAHIVAKKTFSYAKRIYGEQHQNSADALNKLGIASEALGQHDEAKTYYENSLAIYKSSLGEENEKVAMVLNNLGNLFFIKKSFAKSEELHLQSLLMRQHIFSSTHPTVARSSYNLGRLYEKQSKYADAIMFYKQAAVLWKKTLGPNNHNIANTFNNLANVYAVKDNFTAAEEFHLKALRIRETNLGSDHIEVAESLFNLGSICTKQEKYAEAESFYQKSLVIMEKSLDVNDPQIAMTLYSLANIYHIQAQQEYIYNQELIDKIHTDNTIPTGNSSANNKNDVIIIQLRFRKKYVSEIFTKAEPLYRRAIDIVEGKFGAEHPSVKVMKDELAMLHANMESSVEK